MNAKEQIAIMWPEGLFPPDDPPPFGPQSDIQSVKELMAHVKKIVDDLKRQNQKLQERIDSLEMDMW